MLVRVTRAGKWFTSPLSILPFKTVKQSNSHHPAFQPTNPRLAPKRNHGSDTVQQQEAPPLGGYLCSPTHQHRPNSVSPFPSLPKRMGTVETINHSLKKPQNHSLTSPQKPVFHNTEQTPEPNPPKHRYTSAAIGVAGQFPPFNVFAY